MKKIMNKDNSKTHLTTSIALLIAGLVSLATQVPQAVYAYDGGVVSSAAVNHLGLTVDWMTQLEIGVQGHVAGIALQVNENHPTTYFEITYGSGREVISEYDLNAFGEPYGVPGAEAFAQIRKEVIEAELKARKQKAIEVVIRSYMLPESIIYASTSRGLVTAINADTGQTIWKTRVGDVSYTTTGVGANEDHVVVCNGSKVYCLEASSGKVLWGVQSAGSPAASPDVSKSFVFVTLTNGRLEAFPLDGNGVGGETFIGQGLGTAQPLVTPVSVSWPTADGYYSVVPLATPQEEGASFRGELKADSIAYRLRADGELVCSGTSANGNLYITSSDGFIYAVVEKTGLVAWEFSTGDRIEKSAYAHGNDLYFVTSSEKLFKMDAIQGLKSPGWTQPVVGISEFLGISGNKVFALDSLGNLVVLDAASGTPFGIARVSGVDMSLQNTISNRLYLGSKNGLIQCVREVGSPIPEFHVNVEPESQVAAADAPDAENAEAVNQGAVQEPDVFSRMDSNQPGSDNPFGGGANNPFGGGGQPANPPAADNPFGGSAPSGGDNPFGGGGN